MKRVFRGTLAFTPPPPQPPAPVYHGRLARVVDGDTLHIDVQLGFRVSMEVIVRLDRINAPELHGASAAAGQKAKAYLENLLVSNPPLVLEVTGYDTYGRSLTEVWAGPNNLSDCMLQSGNAVPYAK